MAKEYPWSKYQKGVFEFMQYGRGNAVVKACAGSGKTTTLVKCLDYVPDNTKILLTAFNKDIVDELKKRTLGMPMVMASTLHSLGLKLLRNHFDVASLPLDEYKYSKFIKTNIKNLSEEDLSLFSRKEYNLYMENILQLVDFGRCYLASTMNDMDFISERYGLELWNDEKEVALKVIKWGIRNADTVDFTDMVSLPNYLGVTDKKLTFGMIFCDEVQDLNKAQRELLLRCRADGCRCIFFGDDNQAIYGFSGSSADSFKVLQNLPDTITLPLSISYRCAEEIVKYARTFVHDIECSGDGRKGEVLHDMPIDVIGDGDMVLCRNNAPLMGVYNDLIASGVKAFVRGKDIGANMKKIVKRTEAINLSRELDADGVFPRLYADLFETRNIMMVRRGIDKKTATRSSLFQNKLDIIKALYVLTEGLKTAQEAIDKISMVFSDNISEGVSLSTVHKAKGLEADRVWIICRSLMPSKNATLSWELEQEHNLIYVAYTRAKNTLGFIAEDEAASHFDNEMDELNSIEKVIDAMDDIGITDLASDPTFAKEIVANAEEISSTSLSRKAIQLGVQPPIWTLPKPGENPFASVLAKKKLSRRKW